MALATTPANDGDRICIFGHSRGGTVELLMAARDPRYFLESVPAAHLHYGADDRSVPAANAETLRERLAARASRAPYEVFVYPESGHDQPYPEAYQRSGRFLAASLSRGRGRPVR